MIQWKWKWQEQQYDSLPRPLLPPPPPTFLHHNPRLIGSIWSKTCVFFCCQRKRREEEVEQQIHNTNVSGRPWLLVISEADYTLWATTKTEKKTGNLCLWLGLLRNYLQLLRGTVVPNISLEKNQSSVWDGPSQEVLGVSQSHCTTVLHWSWSWAQKSHAHLAQHVCDWMVSLAAAPAVEVDHRSIKRWTDWVVMGTQTHIDPVCYEVWKTCYFEILTDFL